MVMNIEVEADGPDHARESAVALARAQGYARIDAVSTTALGDRRYRVQMTVSR